MRPDISEFSYGFALTSELVQSFGLQSAGAPLFPSLKAEGMPGGGFDVQLPGVPVFLQFKMSDCLTTKNALDHHQLGLPYYRFKIRAPKHSQQHDLLLALEAGGNLVLYAAPRFHTPDELNDAFSNAGMVKRSAFIHPKTIGPLPDVEEHSVSFGSGSLLAVFRSEPQEVELADPEDLFGPILRSRHDEATESEPRGFRELGNQLVDLYASRRPGAEGERARRLSTLASDREPRDYARFVALALFDSELLISADEPEAAG
jgi:hypothetical protein